MDITWANKALKDKKFWEKHNPKVEKRIMDLIESIKQTLYFGIGKPEALKHNLSSLWSRRIDKEHRLIYKYDEKIKSIEIKSCKGHYYPDKD